MPNGGKRPGAGRPKGTFASHTLEAQEFRKRLIERALPKWDAIIDSLITLALHGEIYAIRELNDRIMGKAAQPLAGIDEKGNMKPIPILANLNVSTDNSNQENSAA